MPSVKQHSRAVELALWKNLVFSIFFLLVLICAIHFVPTEYTFMNSLGSVVETISGALLGAAISLLIVLTQLHTHFDRLNMQSSGYKGYRNGYKGIFQFLGERDGFFSTWINKEIDLFGMAMHEFIEYNGMVDFLINKAKAGYKVRVFFANPNSTELALQEQVENKPKKLSRDIQDITKEFRQRILEHPEVGKNLSVYHVKMLPRNFVLRCGGRMIVTSYYHHGPVEAPAIYLRSGKGKNAYSYLKEYIDESALVSNSEKVI